MEQSNDKTQEATPHRRQQAREQGQLARSQDLGSSLLLLGGLGALYWLIGGMVDFFGHLAHTQLGGPAWLSADAQFLGSESWRLLGGLSGIMLPLLGTLTVVAIISSLLQVGFLFLPDRLMPDLGRIDPIAGFQRMMSLAGVVRLLMGLFKVGIVATVAGWALWGQRDQVLALIEVSASQLSVYLVQVVFWITLKVAVALLILAILDYAFQWWRQEQDLRMTSQEVREEMKNLHGDPQVIARRKAVQRQLVLHRLSKTVPKADLVVTNPTELAVALQYAPEKMNAPIVIAKGAGLLAQRIRRLALEHDIPIVEKKPLAQALYKEVDLNRPIPSQMYAAVAELLAYVYQLKGKTMPDRSRPK